MKVALVRIGIDTGSGGIHGPLFKDGTFEYVPIPDGNGIDSRTYSNISGRHGQKLIEYFPKPKYFKMAHQSIHFDPEFTSFTYGDPTPPKSGLRYLQTGDYLIFYCGLEGWDYNAKPALYIIGYFEISAAGYANGFTSAQLKELFGENFHVRHKSIYEKQKDKLVLVKGSRNSRMLSKAVLISTMGKDRTGKPLKILSPEMRKIFGDFGGKLSIQRSPTRWVDASFTERTVQFVKSLV
ncbi:MAG: hypothetical protein ABSB91_02420 [Sedimentisphaerales bacterium]